MNKYWETETPIEVDTGKNILKYFPQAEKLQISMPYWTDSAGEKKQGKTVTFNLTALFESKDKNAAAILADIVAKLEK